MAFFFAIFGCGRGNHINDEKAEVKIEHYKFARTSHKWGDFGSILTHGMIESEIGAVNVCLRRVGPYVPDLSLPSPSFVVVTDMMKGKIEASGLSGATFARVEKAHIVNFDWMKAGLELSEPPFFPPNGEPAGYLLHFGHSPETAKLMPDLWCLICTGHSTSKDFYLVDGRIRISRKAVRFFEDIKSKEIEIHPVDC